MKFSLVELNFLLEAVLHAEQEHTCFHGATLSVCIACLADQLKARLERELVSCLLRETNGEIGTIR